MGGDRVLALYSAVSACDATACDDIATAHRCRKGNMDSCAIVLQPMWLDDYSADSRSLVGGRVINPCNGPHEKAAGGTDQSCPRNNEDCEPAKDS